MQIKVNKSKGLNGEITIPSDKSISHRAVMFSALAKGTSVIENFSQGADCISSLEIIKNLGIDAQFKDKKTLIITSDGTLTEPNKDLYCGNSGTTIRLMSGILAGQSFNSTLTGDASLSKRPMDRVIEPLSLMGGNICSLLTAHCSTATAPIKITGSPLHSIDYVSKLASAQVKSCVLLAGLHASGTTSFTEPHLSRNHTELMLKYLGANIRFEGTKTFIKKSNLEAKALRIPGDISSAAFFIVAGLIVPDSEIILKDVGLNPTRTGLLDVVKNMGGNIEILDKKNISNEEVGDIKIKYSELKGCVIEGNIIPRLIDELPVIAVLATQAQGQTIVKDAQDLRNKESDRIKAIVTELKKLGADIKETDDGFIVEGNGKCKLKGNAEVETYHDHRLAMSLYVAGLICENPILINGFEWVNISFPEFENLMSNLKQL